MGGQVQELKGHDFAKGVSLSDLKEDQMELGYANGESVIVVRKKDRVYAIGANCSHYGAPLIDGILDGNEVACPWHHARFDVRNGSDSRAPALAPVACYSTEVRDGKVFVGAQSTDTAQSQPTLTQQSLKSIAIVGGGAAAIAAARSLRAEGYKGEIDMFTADGDAPYDRPNLSKDYLAGSAPEEWIPLKDENFYRDQKITVHTSTRVSSLDPKTKTLKLHSGAEKSFGAVLLCTGASPRVLQMPAEFKNPVFTLRSLADSRVIREQASKASKAVVIGASFIGLEVAASLRKQKVDVTVVGLEAKPLERVLGSTLSAYLQKIHEEQGVRFALGRTVKSARASELILDNGQSLEADFVVVGAGVSPNVDLALSAGLEVENGIVVNEHFQTSAPGVFAAGDVARHPYFLNGEKVRIEHWVTAQRQGRLAARNILGAREPARIVPFFWSAHYDTVISYVGHAARIDREEVLGDPASGRCAVLYYRQDQVAAVATLGCDQLSLQVEDAWEKSEKAQIEKIVRSHFA